MMRNGLEDSDRQTIFRAVEVEDVLARLATLLLFPLEQFFDFGVLDNGHAFVIVKEPLNDIRQRVVIDVAVTVSPEDRSIRRRILICSGQGWIGFFDRD